MDNIIIKDNFNNYTAQYYFEVEHERSAYIWSHYQINKYTEKTDIPEEAIVIENGQLKGFLYKEKFFSQNDVDKWVLIKKTEQQGGREETSIERACLRKK